MKQYGLKALFNEAEIISEEMEAIKTNIITACRFNIWGYLRFVTVNNKIIGGCKWIQEIKLEKFEQNIKNT